MQKVAFTPWASRMSRISGVYRGSGPDENVSATVCPLRPVVRITPGTSRPQPVPSPLLASEPEPSPLPVAVSEFPAELGLASPEPMAPKPMMRPITRPVTAAPDPFDTSTSPGVDPPCPGLRDHVPMSMIGEPAVSGLPGVTSSG
jgi:hypothetical protein